VGKKKKEKRKRMNGIKKTNAMLGYIHQRDETPLCTLPSTSSFIGEKGRGRENKRDRKR